MSTLPPSSARSLNAFNRTLEAALAYLHLRDPKGNAPTAGTVEALKLQSQPEKKGNTR